MNSTRLLAPLLLASLLPALHAGADPTAAARALVQRLLPRDAVSFLLETIPPASGQDVFEIAGRDGKVVIRGNSALSMAAGLNWYLKYYCHASVSLHGRALNLPRPLPRVETPLRLTSWACGPERCSAARPPTRWDTSFWVRTRIPAPGDAGGLDTA